MRIDEELVTDQSAITGEDARIRKRLGDIVYYFTGVLRGDAVGIVIASAQHSFSAGVQLGADFPNRLEAPHVVNMAKQVLANVICSGAAGQPIQATFKGSSDPKFPVSPVTRPSFLNGAQWNALASGILLSWMDLRQRSICLSLSIKLCHSRIACLICNPTGFWGPTITCKGKFCPKQSPVQDAVGQVLLSICQAVPDGVLVFFPSYSLLDRLTQQWKVKSSSSSLQRTLLDLLKICDPV